MDKRVISAIEGYMFDLPEPSRSWPDYEFKKRSYEKWAVNEILEIVKCNRYISPIAPVEDFICMTESFSGIDHDDRKGAFIFSTARDVAADILDILRAMA